MIVRIGVLPAQPKIKPVTKNFEISKNVYTEQQTIAGNKEEEIISSNYIKNLQKIIYDVAQLTGGLF